MAAGGATTDRQTYEQEVWLRVRGLRYLQLSCGGGGATEREKDQSSVKKAG